MDLWNGFEKEEFLFEGKKAILVFPSKKNAGHDWLLKTEYWDAFPKREIELVSRGFHLAYLENETRFATRADCERKARFADFLAETYNLSPKCVPVGFSCGGAHAINFAGFYPEKIACIFIDAPVLNFLSYPGKIGHSECEYVWKHEFVKAYPGITRAKLLSFDNHPLGKINVLKAHNIPILMVYGTEDETVLYSENGYLMELEYEGSSLLKVIKRPYQGHHPHGEVNNPSEIIEFIENACKKLFENRKSLPHGND